MKSNTDISPETMKGIKVIPISDLLSRRRPICGTATLSPRLPIPISVDTKTRNPNPNPNPNPIILKCLPEPSLITGILSLPSSNQTPPHYPYFSFSDESGSVSCDVINFDFSMIGKKIQVLSWNYIPFKKSGGLLEIINWKFLDSSGCFNVDLFSLGLNDVGSCCDSKAKYIVSGLVKSVSPVLIVPCSLEKTVGEGENVRGFIVEILNSDHLGEGNEEDRHDFVYFSGMFSSWHPAFSRIVGRVVSLSKLKKKLVYLGKEEGRLMYVTSEVTRLCLRNLEEKDMLCRKRKRRGEEKTEFCMYIGVVKGVYMQGMVIELDEEVWLLMTEESLVLTCSVRVGAILRVRNVHIGNPKFRWGKMLILGACSKTNITTISFSPWETGCHMVSQSQSLLRKFIDSLAFPARLWVLLVVQCFRKKFSGSFSEKEMLGTKHKEGLVQTYAKSVLPSLVFQLRHGLFTDFCKHDSCSAGSNVSFGNLSLAVPLSIFLGNCDRIWYSSLLELKNGYEILEDCSQADHPFRENKLSKQPIRRILPSKDFGISLVGNLKLSQDTGRLQFTDATSCIDAVIPDFPSNWNMNVPNVVFEVVDYTLVLEGRPGLWGQTWVLDDDLFSCSSIFRSKHSERQTELTVYVHFLWSNVRCEHFPIHHCLSSPDRSTELDPGIFHLLFVVHKFPLQPQFHGDFFISDSCRLYAEVIVLPWDLNVVPSDTAALPENVLKHEIENCSCNGFAFKRCKTRHASSCANKIEWFEDYKNSSCSNFSNLLSLPHKTRNFYNPCGPAPVQIPCTASVRGIHCQRMAIAGTLCSTQAVGNSASFHPPSSRKLLLEFNSKSMLKYKLMQIGVCYIMKHLAGKCFCDSHEINLGNKVAIDLETRLWSTTFHFNMVGSSSCSCNDPSSGSCSLCETSSKHHLQNELVLHHGCAAHGSFFDVSLHISADAAGHLNVGVQALQEAVTALSVSSANITINGQQAGSMDTVVGNIQKQGPCFGSSLPEGNLISLHGTLMSIHRSGCGTGDGTLDDIHLSKNMKGSICLLVLTDGQTLQIGGCLSSYNYPVGLAPGADVTFHRILALSGQNRLILTPVSFITVHSVKEASTELLSYFSVREETIPSCLISDLTQSDVCKPKRLCGRVVGVYIVILERDKNLDKLLPCIHSNTTIVNIPLAGFILDDGSSRCFCWASGERAATFLRLHDEAPEAGCRSSWWRSKDLVMGKSCSTSSFHLNKILKKHERVTVKNCGSIHDTLSQDLHLSNGSNCFFDTQDQNLLKLIIINACSSTLWSITGHVMDSNSVNSLEKFVMEEQMAVHALQNVWARDVFQVDTLTEARALFQELKPGHPQLL